MKRLGFFLLGLLGLSVTAFAQPQSEDDLVLRECKALVTVVDDAGNRYDMPTFDTVKGFLSVEELRDQMDQFAATYVGKVFASSTPGEMIKVKKAEWADFFCAETVYVKQ